MKILRYSILVLGCILPLIACQAQNGSQKDDSPYKFKNPSWDGTGKIYMGREISHIMGFAGKDWLERDSREAEEGVSLAVKNLPLTSESVVADIGAGSGYYTFRVAERIPDGKIYAVEVQDEALNYLDRKRKELGFEQVIPTKGSPTSPNLPDGAIDVAFMVDVYHELEFPQEMLQSIHQSLKPDGKLILIEYRGEDPTIAIKPLHKMTARQAEKELKANGFKLVENGKFLKIQHFLVFQKVSD
ncbi:class I SAM-dependent methyltransferase [Algoriphagus sp. NF]|uniref:class I SAM-dependent methyltransferase n=1 Tax=Algoriphagus sp. NF TaxID=2992756 RepID=UPI00237A4CBC|nr:class I SAM-dependent methyltransferase [Algoriphagus sp. NF]MDE0560006.1 class I SAM-dependent methyltransferase [Algoriphagus sp. NF]